MLKGSEEVMFYGRGGQGATSAVPYLVVALDYEGCYAQALPAFGGERRGTAVKVSLRISYEPITLRDSIFEPSCLVVLDTKLMTIINVASGMKPGGIAVLNSLTRPGEVDLGVKLSKVGTLDATAIAQEIFGFRPIPLTSMPMLGGFAATTRWVSLDSIARAIRCKMEGGMARNSLKALQLGYESTHIESRVTDD